MKITIEMPWERDLSVNTCRFGAGGHYRKKPHVQAWLDRLAFTVTEAKWEWHKRVGAYGVSFSLQLPITAVVDMRFPDKRVRDTHNYHYLIANGVAAGLHIDDKDLRISTGSVTVDKANPGFTIRIGDRE